MTRFGSATILRGDARRLPLLAGSVAAIVCDPPYGLEFMGKDWDAPWRTGDGFRRSRNPADAGRDDPFGRASRTSPEYVAGVGFGRWCEAWATEALRVLKPGGYMLAFGGTRTWHRLVCAVEDAGFEIRDSMAWLYGSGFPKSLDVSKAIDAATDAARRWQGFGTALKPAHEPIIVARKPLQGTVAATVLAHGTGALNIDGCRVKGGPIASAGGTRRSGGIMGASSPLGGWTATHTGRWPTNVVLSHPPLLDDDGAPIGDACESGCVPGCPVAELDAQSGTLHSQNPATRAHGGKGKFDQEGWRSQRGAEGWYADSSGASRFFPTFRYEAKAPDDERPRVNGVAHPTVKPLALMRWLCRLITPPDGLILDMFAGSGTTLEAALLEGFRVVGIEQDPDYLPLIRFRADRARRRMQPGVARLAATKPPLQAEGQLDLLGDVS